MAETILTNEVKQDEVLPETPVKSAELFIHPITSGIPKISGGGELSFEQKLTDDNDNTLALMKGGISFYSDFSKAVAFRIYHDTNNGELMIGSGSANKIRIGGGAIITVYPDTVYINAASEVFIKTNNGTNAITAICYPTAFEVQSATDGSVINMRIDPTIADTQTSLLLRRNVAGTLTLQRVTMGVADSGGAGFKLLRVPN